MFFKSLFTTKTNRLLLISLIFLILTIPVVTFVLLNQAKLQYKPKAAPESVPPCSGQTFECWGECQPGTRKEYEVCCSAKNRQGQCIAWCQKRKISDDSPNCGGGQQGQPTSCEGARNTCCGGQRYMPDGSIGPQPWCHSDDYEYTCNCPNQSGYYSPCQTGNRCGAFSNTNGRCEKSDCSVSRDPCPPGNVACADDIACNSDCPSVRKQYDVCRGKITNNDCQACQGSCEDQLHQHNQGNCDITCDCVEQLRAQGKIDNNQYRNLAGSCAYAHGEGCPNPANYPCSNIQSDVVAWGANGEWVYLCHSMWQDGRDWWECQTTTPTPTPTNTPTPTPTQTPTPTETPTPTPTGTVTPAPTNTPTPTPTPTNTPTPTPTEIQLVVQTNTPTPTTPTQQVSPTLAQAGIRRIIFFLLPAALIILGLLL